MFYVNFECCKRGALLLDIFLFDFDSNYAFKHYISVLLTNFTDGEGAYDMERGGARCREGANAYMYTNNRYACTYYCKGTLRHEEMIPNQRSLYHAITSLA